jgi:hypothetical protein
MTPAPGLMTVRAYARHRGISHTAVQAAIRKGRLAASLKREGKKVSIDAAVADQEWTANTDLTKAPTSVKERETAHDQPPAAARAPDVDGPEPPLEEGLTLSQVATAEKYWTARRKKLEYQARATELVPAKDVSDRLAGIFTRCRTKLLGIPAKVKTALPQLSHQDVSVIDRLVREALEELADGGALA